MSSKKVTSQHLRVIISVLYNGKGKSALHNDLRTQKPSSTRNRYSE